MVRNPRKNTALLIYPFEEKEKTSQTLSEPPFPRYFMIESINKSIREKRYYDHFRNLASFNKAVPLPLRNKSYDDLFKKLIERCHVYFTSEYGKNENDYRRFVDGSTKIYENGIKNENYDEERMRFFKKETALQKQVSKHSISSKKSTLSIISRLKIKMSKLGKSSRLRLTQKMRKGRRALIGKAKSTFKKIDFQEEIEKSTSELSLSSEDISVPIRVIEKKSNPFVFKLSDPIMKQTGITMNYQLPLRIITFPAVPTNPLTYWFQKRAEILRTYYPDGNICSQFEKDGSGVVYHKNGDRAIIFQLGRISPLIIIYSQSKKIRNKLQKSKPMAVFDLRSNGVVYDNNGRKRLIYDQAEGILIDQPSKVPFRFKWNSYKHIMCRRNELQFVPPTDLKDFDYEIKKAERERKIFSRVQGRRPTSRLLSGSSRNSVKYRNIEKKLTRSTNVTSLSIKGSFKMSSKTNKFRKRKTRPLLIQLSASKEIIPQRPKLNTFHFKTESSRKISGHNSLLQNMKQEKILKFVGKGFVIKPLMTPCSELYNVHHISSIFSPDPLFNQESNARKSHEQVTGRIKGHQISAKRINKILPEMKLIPQTRCTRNQKHRSLLKPIVMKITENVSLTVMDQEHIHIDFSSFPMHYMFNLGVKINTEQVETVFDIRDSEIQKESIPSIFEALKKKCFKLYEINNEINEVRFNADKRLNIEKIKKLKTWGQNKYLGKIPFCKLLNNECSCKKCIDAQCVCCP